MQTEIIIAGFGGQGVLLQGSYWHTPPSAKIKE